MTFCEITGYDMKEKQLSNSDLPVFTAEDFLNPEDFKLNSGLSHIVEIANAKLAAWAAGLQKMYGIPDAGWGVELSKSIQTQKKPETSSDAFVLSGRGSE